MSEDRSAWRTGGRAWDRLGRWYTRRPADDDPLAALGDIGVVRRLLDEVELEAVRAARRRGRSWAEIATKLGVTRQSAWERWRDLDDVATTEAVEEEAVPGPARREGRRKTVRVPNVVGLTFDDAVVKLAERGFFGVPDDPGVVPADLLGHAVVTAQGPEAGARVAAGSRVRLWVARGGGAGVREPRRPGPTPLTGRKVLDEPSAEAVG